MASLISARLARTTEVASRILVTGVLLGKQNHVKYIADCRTAEYETHIFSLELSDTVADIVVRAGQWFEVLLD